MQKIVNFQIKEIEPERETIFREIGYSKTQTIPKKIQHLYEKSLIIFHDNSSPIGMISLISKKEFHELFLGEGNNSPETPIQNIFSKADNLILFAVTLGEKVSDKIRQLFRENDFALGHMLDCIASLAADNMVRKLEKIAAKDAKKHEKNRKALAYSPGYCGWHISGQKKLFEFLQPEKIGISLNAGFLMIPLKSVSGVLISGKKEIHRFKNNFSFCALCKTKSCVERM